MGILDKLRPQAKWKHPDPATRLEGIQELEDTDQDVLATLAREDADARVRRAAAARLADAALLAALVRNETDEEVRAAAVERLAALAGGADEGIAHAAIAALAALGRERELAAVARAAGHDARRRAAAERVADPKALGGIARHAAEPGARLLAVERLADAAELQDVVLRGEFADAAVAALDRLPALAAADLAAIGQKARTKAAQKRARALLRAQEAAAPAAAAEPEYREADQQRAAELVGQMEALGTAGDIQAVREAYAAARVAWVELLADAEVRSETVTRFEQLSEAVRQRLAADEAARAETARQAEALAREQADRAAVCAEVEALIGEDLADRLAAARATWEGMPPMPDTWAASLQSRFDEACRAAERRHERRVKARELAERAPALVAEVEVLAAAAEYATVRNQWYALRKQWQAIGREVEVDAELKTRYEAAARALEAREQEVRDARQHQQQENLQRLQALVQELETRAAAESLTLKQAEQILKDVKLAIGTMGPLPSKQDRDDLTVRLQAVRTAVQPRIQEMREAEEWKRWANVQIQEELCAKMEALIPNAEAEPEKAATEMRQLQEKWKQVAAAPRSQAEALWTRFKTAQQQVYEKCKDFFAQQAAERQENLKAKEALCARAEALADSTDWVATAEALKALQAEWKAIGPVTRGHEKAVWERFRAACDRFFSRRHEDLKHRKHEWADNLAKKEALIAEAEKLAESTEWEAAAQRIKALQAEWKKIGPVRRNKSEVVWQRFRAACDTFFERFKNRDQAALAGKVHDREAAVAEIEALVPAADAADAPAPDDLYARVQAARARWLQGPDLPRHVLMPLADRVNAAMLALVARWPEAFTGTELDTEVTRKKMEKLVAKVEALIPAGEARESTANLSPAELLARQWREALAANTMGAGAARQAEEARQRAAEQELRSAQAAWLRLGPVPAELRKPLQERFDRAVRRFQEHRRRHLAKSM
ncbi:MAG: DUF349 domain-containing protein [Acidobacteriota bacterium]